MKDFERKKEKNVEKREIDRERDLLIGIKPHCLIIDGRDFDRWQRAPRNLVKSKGYLAELEFQDGEICFFRINRGKELGFDTNLMQDREKERDEKRRERRDNLEKKIGKQRNLEREIEEKNYREVEEERELERE